MISYICLLATVFANLSCADDMDNSKFDNMIPYGKQEVSYTYPKGEGSLRVLTFNIRHCAGNDDGVFMTGQPLLSTEWNPMSFACRKWTT